MSTARQLPPWSDLIFDLDGTLIDSAPAILAGFETILRDAGITPVLPIDSRLIGPPLLETLARLTGSRSEALLQSLADAFKANYDSTGVFQTRAFGEIPATLEALATSGLRMHIATNKRWLPTAAILKNLGWECIFHSVYTQDKPAGYSGKSAMLTHLLSTEKINAERAVYIGGTPEDGVAANTNRMSFIAVTWGYGSFYNRPDAGPQTHAGTCAELLNALLPGTSPVMPYN